MSTGDSIRKAARQELLDLLTKDEVFTPRTATIIERMCKLVKGIGAAAASVADGEDFIVEDSNLGIYPAMGGVENFGHKLIKEFLAAYKDSRFNNRGENIADKVNAIKAARDAGLNDIANQLEVNLKVEILGS